MRDARVRCHWGSRPDPLTNRITSVVASVSEFSLLVCVLHFVATKCDTAMRYSVSHDWR